MSRKRGLGLGILVAVLVALLVVWVAAGGTSPAASPTPSGVALDASAPVVVAPAGVASPVTGVVLKVDATGLDAVSGFTIRTASGVVVSLRIVGTTDNAADFPPSHLSEHIASAAPIRVWFRGSAGAYVAYRIEDAPGGRAGPSPRGRA